MVEGTFIKGQIEDWPNKSENINLYVYGQAQEEIFESETGSILPMLWCEDDDSQLQFVQLQNTGYTTATIQKIVTEDMQPLI